MGVSCLGVVVQGGIIQIKMFEGQKSRGQLPYPWGDFIGGDCPGVIFRGEKSGGNCPGRISLETTVRGEGVIVGGNVRIP